MLVGVFWEVWLEATTTLFLVCMSCAYPSPHKNLSVQMEADLWKHSQSVLPRCNSHTARRPGCKCGVSNLLTNVGAMSAL